MAIPRKPIEDECLDNLGRFVKAHIVDRFGGQQAAARELRKAGHYISQSHLSQLVRGAKATRSAGLRVVLRLHAYTGVSIDEMFGIRQTDAALERRIKSVVERTLAEHAPGAQPRSAVRRK